VLMGINGNMPMSKSILQKEKKCFVCGMDNVLHKHHIYAGVANRPLSEKYGCWVWLCPYHHNMSNHGIHADIELDKKIKQICQERFEETHTREEFMQIFGRNYL